MKVNNRRTINYFAADKKFFTLQELLNFADDVRKQKLPVDAEVTFGTGFYGTVSTIEINYNHMDREI